jgi:two-component system, NarL family, sensor histidine kinase BarA
MSYRTFKRFLGETNLERKCRWLLGVGTLVLMMTSFIVFARLTEGLASEQPLHIGRAVVGA